MSIISNRHSGESRYPVRPLMLSDAPFLDSGFRRNDGNLPTITEDTP